MNQNDHKAYFISQQAIILNSDGKFLILRNQNGWMLPGGRMEYRDVGWFDALQREVREETALEILHVKRICDVDISPTGKTYAVIFECEVKNSSEMQLSQEHQEYAWTTVNELDTYPFAYPDLPRKLKKVLQ